MAGDGVEIPLASMEELSTALGLIIAEYADAGTETNLLEQAIDRPRGDGTLAAAASSFESEWNDKRETQRRHLEEMKKRIDDSREAWAEVDAELAASLEASE